MTTEILTIAIIWILFLIINYSLGAKREIGGIEALLISIFLSPIVGFIFIAFSKDKDDRRFQIEMLHLLKSIAENTQKTSNTSNATNE